MSDISVIWQGRFPALPRQNHGKHSLEHFRKDILERGYNLQTKCQSSVICTGIYTGEKATGSYRVKPKRNFKGNFKVYIKSLGKLTL